MDTTLRTRISRVGFQRRRQELKMTTPEPFVPHALEKRTLQRITRRLMPFLTLLFIIAYIDRVNVGYAAVDLSKDLGFDPAVSSTVFVTTVTDVVGFLSFLGLAALWLG